MISQKLRRIMELQSQYTSGKSSPMDERGRLVKYDLPEWLKTNLRLIDPKSLIEDLAIEGQDGIGNKSRVPWVRIFSQSRSPKAPIGWYVVLLFSEDGQDLYVTLGHGSTKPSINFESNGVMVHRSEKEMADLVSWGHSKLQNVLSKYPRLIKEIRLSENKNSLGSAYERSTLVAYQYRVDDLPSDDELVSDLKDLVSLLAEIYVADADDPAIPGAPSQELEAVAEAILVAAGKSRYNRKQGRNRLSAKENRVIELYAVELAIQYFKDEGWERVEDVGDKKSYDIHCTRGEMELYVEVKGTTSYGNSVVITRNELTVHREQYPNNALFVVSKIKLEKGENPVATGGEVSILRPWKILDSDLSAIAFDYYLK
jgi:MrcB-like, N-terminal domain/Domain of unknown function (DUF3883)